MQRGAAFDRLGADEACAYHQRGPFMELIRDRIVGRSEAGGLDLVARDLSTPLGIAELADQLHILRGVDELELFDGRASRWKQVAVLDQTGRADEVHRELDPDRLEWMLIRQVMFHELVSVDERDRSGHRHLP